MRIVEFATSSDDRRLSWKEKSNRQGESSELRRDKACHSELELVELSRYDGYESKWMSIVVFSRISETQRSPRRSATIGDESATSGNGYGVWIGERKKIEFRVFVFLDLSNFLLSVFFKGNFRNLVAN